MLCKSNIVFICVCVRVAVLKTVHKILCQGFCIFYNYNHLPLFIFNKNHVLIPNSWELLFIVQ